MTIEERVTNLETQVALHAQLFSDVTNAIERLTVAVSGLSQRFDRFEARMEARMDRFEARMDRFESRLTNVETDMALIKSWLGPQSGDSTGL